VWNATSLSSVNRQPGTAVEVDITGAYVAKLSKRMEVGIGYCAYLFPKPLAGHYVDGSHEFFGSWAITTPLGTPTLGVYTDFIRLKGAYAFAGFAKTFTYRKATLTPQVSAGPAAYEESPAHLNDVSAAVATQVFVYDSIYVTGRLAYSFMGGRVHELPTHDESFSGRSVPWGMVGLGALL